MVLHVLADAAQFMHEGHADPAEMLAIADARQLQDVRRADGTRRQDRLAARIGPFHSAARTAARDFVRNCQTPILVLVGDTPAQPYQTSVDIASLVPTGEVPR